MKENYQDYVIKNGEFVGEFERMYQKFEDPWHQSKIETSIARETTAVNLNRYGISSLVEYGCGHGHFTNMLSTRAKCEILGVDISATAIEKAKSLFPKLNFQVGDVSNIEELAKIRKFDCILFAEITWYLLPELKNIFEKFSKFCPGSYFFHNLVFYPKGSQKYGNEYFTNLDEFIDFVPFKLIETTVRTPMNESETIETHSVFKIEKK